MNAPNTSIIKPPSHPAVAPASSRAGAAPTPHRNILRRNLRRLWVLLAGGAILILGILIAPLPGPGFTILAPLGLGIIATEFEWARRLLDRLTKRLAQVKEQTDRIGRRTSRWWIAPAIITFWGVVWALAEYSPIPSFIVWAAAFPLFMPVVLWAWASLRFRGIGSRR